MSATGYGLILEGDKLVVTAAPRGSFFDPRFLVAALLEHVALGDGVICDAEATAMVSLVADHFELEEPSAQKKLSQALALYASNLDLAMVGNVLRNTLSSTERVDVLVMLLEVIAADGRQGSDELAAFDEVAAVLSISDEERHAAFSQYFDAQKPESEAEALRIHLS
ncbi:MAG: TerB family tellurite resistance protein [Halioglobus sp.]